MNSFLKNLFRQVLSNSRTEQFKIGLLASELSTQEKEQLTVAFTSFVKKKGYSCLAGHCQQTGKITFHLKYLGV